MDSSVSAYTLTPLQSMSILFTALAIMQYINQRFLKWPMVLAMSIMGSILAILLVLMGKLGILDIQMVEAYLRGYDFENLVLHGLLAPLLFAGAMFVNVGNLKQWWKPIAALASVGVFVSAFITATFVYYIAQAFYMFGLIPTELGFLWCLLFGSLIAATDPIAALAIVKKAGAPKQMETKLVGESLFNDATSVMMFLVVYGILKTGDLSAHTLAYEVLVAPFGAALLGVGMGYGATFLIGRVDHHPTEILITVALATGVYGFAELLHLSAPIAVVAAGLVIGHKARKMAMTEKTREHLDTFWECMDELLNALLFGLVGLELLLIDLPPIIMAMGVLVWLAVLVGRWGGVFGSLMPMRRHGGFGKGTMKVMVWGGLRGAISLALAMSLPPGPESSILVALAFIVVALSGSVQGLTLSKIIPRQAQEDAKDTMCEGMNDERESSAKN